MARIGWIDALFNLFIRPADAFDIHPPPVLYPDGVPRVRTDQR